MVLGARTRRVSARHAVLNGYEWPTSILTNMTLEGALGHVTSSTDFMLPYLRRQLMGDRATLRQDRQWLDTPIELEALQAANPFPDVDLEAAATKLGGPGSGPLRDQVRPMSRTIRFSRRSTTRGHRDRNRETSINVRRAENHGSVSGGGSVGLGTPVRLPLIAEDTGATLRSPARRTKPRATDWGTAG
jgi:hypothetical protein